MSEHWVGDAGGNASGMDKGKAAPRPRDGRWQRKRGGVSGARGRPGRVKKGIQRTPLGSAPFLSDEIGRGYRFHPIDESANNANWKANSDRLQRALLQR